MRVPAARSGAIRRAACPAAATCPVDPPGGGCRSRPATAGVTCQGCTSRQKVPANPLAETAMAHAAPRWRQLRPPRWAGRGSFQVATSLCAPSAAVAPPAAAVPAAQHEPHRHEHYRQPRGARRRTRRRRVSPPPSARRCRLPAPAIVRAAGRSPYSARAGRTMSSGWAPATTEAIPVARCTVPRNIAANPVVPVASPRPAARPPTGSIRAASGGAGRARARRARRRPPAPAGRQTRAPGRRRDRRG